MPRSRYRPSSKNPAKMSPRQINLSTQRLSQHLERVGPEPWPQPHPKAGSAATDGPPPRESCWSPTPPVSAPPAFRTETEQNRGQVPIILPRRCALGSVSTALDGVQRGGVRGAQLSGLCIKPSHPSETHCMALTTQLTPRSDAGCSTPRIAAAASFTPARATPHRHSSRWDGVRPCTSGGMIATRPFMRSAQSARQFASSRCAPTSLSGIGRRGMYGVCGAAHTVL